MNPKDQKDDRNKQADSSNQNPSKGYQSPSSSPTDSQKGSSQKGSSQPGRDDSKGWKDTPGGPSGNEPRRSPGGQPDGNTRKAGDKDSNSKQGGMSDGADRGNRSQRDPND